MPKKLGIAIVTVGAVLITSALLLLLYNRYQDAQAGREAAALLAKVQAALDAHRGDLDPELPVVELDGYEYVGYVEITALEVELPVLADWDYDRLKIAPCRQFGSSRSDDLVIAAHNYQTHFGRLKELKEGDTVRFTDMEGIVNTYAVSKCVTLQPTEVDAVQNSGYDLVLYTCTLGGRTRVTVFCDRVE